VGGKRRTIGFSDRYERTIGVTGSPCNRASSVPSKTMPRSTDIPYGCSSGEKSTLVCGSASTSTRPPDCKYDDSAVTAGPSAAEGGVDAEPGHRSRRVGRINNPIGDRRLQTVIPRQQRTRARPLGVVVGKRGGDRHAAAQPVRDRARLLRKGE